MEEKNDNKEWKIDNYKAEFEEQLQEEARLNALIAENLGKVESGMNRNKLIKLQEIQSRIFTIRGLQVMLDKDLAQLYNVETRSLKQAVKRNIKRFPDDFMFELSDREIDVVVSQNVIPSKQVLGGAKPFAFTEQGVANLSSILNSDIAIDVNIKIMRAFVAMRRFIISNAQVFQRLDTLEMKQIETDNKVTQILTALENKEIQPKQGIFFDGQIFDAYRFISNLIRSARKSIILIDNYIDDTVLTLFSKRKKRCFSDDSDQNGIKTAEAGCQEIQ